MNEFKIGDKVDVLLAVHLPLETLIGTSTIQRVTKSSSGESLYWLRGFDCARTARVLRRAE